MKHGNTGVALGLAVAWLGLGVGYDALRPEPDPFQLLPGPPVAVTQREPDFIDRRLGSGVRGAGWREWTRQHRLEGRFRPNHNLHRLLDNELLESHPEWFPLLNGQRVPMSGPKGPQPNLEHPDFALHVASQALQFWEEYPDNPTFSISVTDSVRFDESPQSRARVEPIRYFRRRPDYSDLVFLFSHRVAEAVFDRMEPVSDLGTDRYLTAYAYFWAENVPSFLESNNGDAALPDALHPRLLPYLTSDRAQGWHPEFRENDRDLTARWGRAGTEIIGAREYYMGDAYFIPRHYPGLVSEFIPYLHRHGTRAFYAGGRPVWGFQAPFFWLSAQLLWQADQDADALQERFFNTMYGPAADAMRRFFDRCEEIWMSQEGHWQWLKYYRHPSQAELFPPDVCMELEDMLDQAFASVGGKPGASTAAKRPSLWSTHSIYRARVNLTREAFAFTRDASRLYHAWKACAANPLSTQAHHEQWAKDYPRWQEAHRAMEDRTTGFGGPDARWDARQRLLQLNPRARAAPIAPRAEAVRFALDRGTLHPGDVNGISAWDMRGVRLRNGWTASAQPYEDFEFRRIPGAGPGHADAVQVRNANYLSLYRWVKVDDTGLFDARIQFRGKVSPGSWCGLYLAFFDENRQPLGAEFVDETPPGLHREWVPLAVSESTPPGAHWMFVSVRVLHQPPGDWLLLGTPEN